jgi:hypothetical protein
MRELHKILFDAPPPPHEDPEKTRWRVMTMLKGLKAEQNEEALAALQQITAALNTSGGTPPPRLSTRRQQQPGRLQWRAASDRCSHGPQTRSPLPCW